MSISEVKKVSVAIIGGGPSGLQAAAGLAKLIPGGVTVFDRESQLGGIPRHSDHPGYGIRDMGKFITGPKYARILVSNAEKAGAELVAQATVTDWTGEKSFNVTTPQGRYEVQADVVILATGARERARAARMIPGDRSAGVITTGQLQNLVHIKHETVGKRAVIIGAELVSWSAALSLKHAGCKTVMLTTEYPQVDSYSLFSVPGKFYFGAKVAKNSRVTRVIGKPRVEAVEIENTKTGKRTIISCDTVVFTGGWIPDNELARSAGVELDSGTKGPVVDTEFRTNISGVFAVGNMLHPVDTADVAALDGSAVVKPVVEYLNGKKASNLSASIQVEEPLRWISPALIRSDDQEAARGRLLSWSDKLIYFPRVAVRQKGKLVAQKRLWWPAAPGRVFRIPSSVLKNIDYSAGDIVISIN
ncbi:NAD(P)/FAD-dependent oxidoreductase [Aurantimicrobium sp.]|uniref:NAD(P)/FAD-dependent oxidoreductase n=1 Tax=Aurantimicrobium sp. TaxID=1930784 RepID=UPI002FC7DF01